MNLADYEKILQFGWLHLCFFETTEADLIERIVEIARQIGSPVPSKVRREIFDRLKPTEARLAKAHSLSKIYSLSEFPLHIDTAHWTIPCRFIILACVSSGLGNRKTTLLDTKRLNLSKIQTKLLYNTPLRVKNGRYSFFGTVLSSDRAFIRYDPGCMKAVSPDGNEILDMFTVNNWPNLVDEIDWIPGKVVIIDNWRMLHGRGYSTNTDNERNLLRVMVK